MLKKVDHYHGEARTRKVVGVSELFEALSEFAFVWQKYCPSLILTIPNCFK